MRMGLVEPIRGLVGVCLSMCICVYPGGSAGKESTCNDGDLGSIPGLGRSLGKGKATHFNILAWKIPGPLRGLEGVPGLPGAPQDEAGLTRKFET